LSSGWIWEIPLQNTRSLGYVYSSSYINDEDAEAELRKFEGAHSESLGTRIVPFKVGRREHAWYRNCVSIGLSGGFIEPLESTGLYLSDLATVMLAEHFPHHCDMLPMAIRFNRILTNRFYEILDFINMHYCLTRRNDTDFWREVQKPERINDRLKAKLEYWKMKPPSAADFQDQFLPGQKDTPLIPGMMDGDYRSPMDTAGLWNHESYEAILFGMDFLRDECDQRFGKDRPRTLILRQIVERLRAAPQKLPPHALWLQRVLGMPSYH
jgi:tryptophan halogenase